jgi:DNA-binding transcriptional MerR regulator
MKLRELVDRTGVSTETIQFYLREGILPKPRKRGRAQADYGEHYVELISLIKDLQEKHFLPLAVIKKVIRRLKNISPSEEHYFRMQSEFFSPVGYLLSQQEVEGEDDFREITGLGRKWLAKAEIWGIITPEKRDNVKVFSSEDVAIGKVMVEMDCAGLGPKDGFDPEVLRHYKDNLQKMISTLGRTFTDQLYGNVSDDEFAERGFISMNLMGVYFFYLFRKLAQKDTAAYIEQLERERHASPSK